MSHPPIAACVFDVYGTLLDLFSSTNPNIDDPNFFKLLRQKQLEYSLFYSLMGRYTDFLQISEEALHYCIKAFNLSDKVTKQDLVRMFHNLNPYPDVTETLTKIGKSEYKLSVLSNANLNTLRASLNSAQILKCFDMVFSVETTGVCKPHSKSYQIICDGLRLEPNNVLYVSANCWDISGAAIFGFHTVWINRSKLIFDKLPAKPEIEITNLPELLQHLEIT